MTDFTADIMITIFFPTNGLLNYTRELAVPVKVTESCRAQKLKQNCLDILVWSPRYDIRKIAYLSKTCCTTWLLVAVFQQDESATQRSLGMSRYVKICHAAIYYSLCFLLLVLVILHSLCCRISISRELHNEGQKEIIPATSSYQDIIDLEAEKPSVATNGNGALKAILLWSYITRFRFNEWSALMECRKRTIGPAKLCKTILSKQVPACSPSDSFHFQFGLPIDLELHEPAICLEPVCSLNQHDSHAEFTQILAVLSAYRRNMSKQL